MPVSDDVRLALLPAVREWNERHGDAYDGICEACFATGHASLFLCESLLVCEQCSEALASRAGGAA
jgi:hypothetical protein